MKGTLCLLDGETIKSPGSPPGSTVVYLLGLPKNPWTKIRSGYATKGGLVSTPIRIYAHQANPRMSLLECRGSLDRRAWSWGLASVDAPPQNAL
jgi:hypothetical protein